MIEAICQGLPPSLISILETIEFLMLTWNVISDIIRNCLVNLVFLMTSRLLLKMIKVILFVNHIRHILSVF